MNLNHRLLAFAMSFACLVVVAVFMPDVIRGQDTKTTPNPTPSESAESSVDSLRLEKIKALKERVATRVAELRKGNIVVIGGVVKDVTGDEILLFVGENTLSLFLLPETTIASSAGQKVITTKGAVVKSGETIAVLGTPTQKDNTYNAQSIIREGNSHLYVGKIVSVDTTQGTFVMSVKGTSFTVDVETITKTSIYNGEAKAMLKSGLSKLHNGDTVHLFATDSGTDRERLTALRILVITGSSTNTQAVTPSQGVITASPVPTRPITPAIKSPAPTIKKPKPTVIVTP